MFKKLKSNPGLIMFAIIMIGIITLFSILYFNESKMGQNYQADIARIPEPEKLTHIDSLPYYQYKEIADSIKHIEDNEKQKNTLIPVFINPSTGFIGFQQTLRTWYGWYGDNQSHTESGYYISLPNYVLDEKYAFEFSNGKNYLRRIIGDVKEIETVKESKVAYFPETKTVLIPVSRFFFSIGRICLLVLLIAISIALLYICIVLPINILVNISQGKVFTEINIRDLHILSYTTIGYLLIQMIMPYIVSLFFFKQIPSEFSISFQRLWVSEWPDMIIGIILLAITRAFIKGYKLQQEQDLTV